MAPYVQEDESHVNVAGGREQAPVLLSPGAALVRIADDRSKGTMRRAFGMALRRPLVADMYLAARAFEGDVQTCGVHVWRKSESLAVRHGTGSPEQTYSAMLLGTYGRARDAAARITEMAGGPPASICDAGRSLRAVPGLTGLAEDAVAGLDGEIGDIISAYRHGEVSGAETRRYADTLENARPYMFTFLLHPGMPGHTNDCERLIRGRVVMPRRAQVLLPDWKAAENQASLQTVHANAAIRGVFPGEVVSARRGSWRPPPPRGMPPMPRRRKPPPPPAPDAAPTPSTRPRPSA